MQQSDMKSTEQIRQLICLNPECPLSKKKILFLNRKTNDVFSFDELKQFHFQCTQWILNINTMRALDSREQQVDLSRKFSLNFRQRPLRCLQNIPKMSEWIKGLLKQFFFKMTFRINCQLESILAKKMRDYQDIEQIVFQSLKEINDYSNLVRYKKTQNFDKNERLKQFYELVGRGSLQLMDIQAIQQALNDEVAKALDKLSQKIINTNKKQPEFQLHKRNAYTETMRFIQSEELAFHQKLQKISRGYKVELLRAKYDNQSCKYMTKCWICKQNIFGIQNSETLQYQNIVFKLPASLNESSFNASNSSINRQFVYKKLYLHLLEKHYDEIVETFMYKQLKFNYYETSISSVLEEIQLYNKDIWIIDRQNAGQFQLNLQNTTNFYSKNIMIDVVNKCNTNLVKNPYLTAHSTKKDAADILMTLLTAELLGKTTKKIWLVTFDHFGVVLQEIMEQYFPRRFEAVKNKEADQIIEKLYK